MSDESLREDSFTVVTDPTEMQKFMRQHDVGLVCKYNLRVNADVRVRKYDDYCAECFCLAVVLQELSEKSRVFAHGAMV